MTEQYYMPVKTISGRDCLKNSSDALKKYGDKALIICGYRSADINGAIWDATYALDSAKIEYEIYRGIDPNPTVEQVRAVSDIAINKRCDFILAIGGGSVIDAAKAVAILSKNSLTDDELFTLKDFDSVLPVIAVPTTAGTGSEVTQYSIITNVKKETKSFVVSDKIFPRIAYLDGKYMENLPHDTTVNTTIDALSHAIEGYLAVRSTSLGRVLALNSIRLIAPILKKMNKEEKLTIQDRDELLYASMLAGIVISQSGTTAVHAVGYSLTYFKHVDHGRANGLLMPSYLEFLNIVRKDDISIILDALGMTTITEFRTLCFSLLETEKLTEEEIIKFSEIAINAGNIHNTEPKPTIDVLRIMLNDASGLN